MDMKSIKELKESLKLKYESFKCYTVHDRNSYNLSILPNKVDTINIGASVEFSKLYVELISLGFKPMVFKLYESIRIYIGDGLNGYEFIQ